VNLFGFIDILEFFVEVISSLLFLKLASPIPKPSSCQSDIARKNTCSVFYKLGGLYQRHLFTFVFVSFFLMQLQQLDFICCLSG
jgi:hypothetical protein